MVTKTNLFALPKLGSLLGCTASLKIGGIFGHQQNNQRVCETGCCICFTLLGDIFITYTYESGSSATRALVHYKQTQLDMAIFYVYFERLKRQQKLIEALLKQSSCILKHKKTKMLNNKTLSTSPLYIRKAATVTFRSTP